MFSFMKRGEQTSAPPGVIPKPKKQPEAVETPALDKPAIALVEIKPQPLLERRSVMRLALEPAPESIEVKRIDQLSELPEYTDNLTRIRIRSDRKEGKSFSVPDSLRQTVAILQIAESAAIIVLNGDGAVNSNEFGTARSILRQRGYSIVGTYVASPQAFSELASSEAPPDEIEKVDQSEAVKLFDQILQAGAALGSSDIHVCIREQSTRVLCRVHGRLTPVNKFNRIQGFQAVSVAYNKLALETSRSKTEPQFLGDRTLYCVIDRSVSGKRWRIRFQSFGVEGGTDVVLRLLPGEAVAQSKTLADLGYEPSQQKELSLAIRKNVGALIVAGGTGSGKSTMLMVAMTMDPNRRFYKSYTIEDPVEYRMFGISQISVRRDISDTDGKSNPFIESMRAMMRADPDVVMTGEIRDKESADLFAPMVMSGHRGLTTLHASSAWGIIARLTNAPINMPRPVLAEKRFISALVYQCLVPTLCPHCAKPAKGNLPDEYLTFIKVKFQVSTANMRVANHEGCRQCIEGINGVTVAAEIVTPTIEMKAMILDGREAIAEIKWRESRSAGFDEPDMGGKTAFEHALYKSLQGLIDPRDVEMAFESFETYEIVGVVS